MKKLKLIYNPFSGDKSFKFELDVCISIFQEAGYEVHIFRTLNKGDIDEHISNMDDNYDIIVVSGGDGSINLVVSAMMKRGLAIPLGIIPSGTANDFASYLNLHSNNIEECCKVIVNSNPVSIDVGRANDQYFINVCGGGLLANVSQNIDKNFKDALGTTAYYLKGIEQIPNFSPIPLRITNSEGQFDENFYLFLILNSAGAGSFSSLAPDASISDGMFDFIGIKAKPVYELAVLFLKILRKEHIGDSNIVYFKDNYIEIESLDPDSIFKETDVDGEDGPNLPLKITLLPKALKVFSNRKR